MANLQGSDWSRLFSTCYVSQVLRLVLEIQRQIRQGLCTRPSCKWEKKRIVFGALCVGGRQGDKDGKRRGVFQEVKVGNEFRNHVFLPLPASSSCWLQAFLGL